MYHLQSHEHIKLYLFNGAGNCKGYNITVIAKEGTSYLGGALHVKIILIINKVLINNC